MAHQFLYQWRVQNLQGHLATGEIIAQSRQEACRRLMSKGQWPLKLEWRIKFSPQAWRKNGLIFFTQQLAILLHAGLTIQAALRLLVNGQNNKFWRWLLKQIEQQIASGLSFSQALSCYPVLFHPLYCALIRVGELTGQLEKSCLQLAQQQQKILQLQQQMGKALFYPCFVLVTTMIVMVMMLSLVVPVFEQTYCSFNVELPLLTRTILMLSSRLKQQGVAFFCGVMLLLTVYCSLRHTRLHWRVWEQHILLQLPLLGPIVHQVCLARLTRVLATTQCAGISLLSGLQAAEESVGNAIYQQAIVTVSKDIQQGLSLYQAFQRQPLFPPLLQQMVQVGEEASALETMLANAAEFYENNVHHRVSLLVKLLEPLLMVFIGIIVAALVISMYLPIFKLGQIVH